VKLLQRVRDEAHRVAEHLQRPAPAEEDQREHPGTSSRVSAEGAEAGPPPPVRLRPDGSGLATLDPGDRAGVPASAGSLASELKRFLEARKMHDGESSGGACAIPEEPGANAWRERIEIHRGEEIDRLELAVERRFADPRPTVRWPRAAAWDVRGNRGDGVHGAHERGGRPGPQFHRDQVAGRRAGGRPRHRRQGPGWSADCIR
jgi:hypothetical protein